MKPITSKLTVPNRMEYLNAIIGYVLELAKTSGFNKKEIGQIHLAVEEAVTNVIRHSLEENPEESFTIVCEQSDSDLCIRIQEKGVPFDPDRMPAYSPDAPLEQTAGLGLYLMKESMDEVRYINRGKKGMETCLVKRLGNRRINERLSIEEKKPFESAPQTDFSPNYTIRRLLPEEAIEVSKCAYRTYGYTYAEYIYFPEKIVEYNHNGTMASFVAVTDDGKLMGHMALKFSLPGAAIAEVGVAFVKPAYRKLGLADQLGVNILNEANKMKLAGIMTCPVTIHPITQKMSLAAGFHECGILAGIFPEGFNFKALAGKACQRESLLLAFKPLDISETVSLFPPEPYKDIVQKIYQRMDVSFFYPDANIISVDAGPPDIRLSVVSSLNMADVMVVDYGDGDFDTLRNMWRQLCVDKLDVIYLYLNMEDPRCAGFIEKCRSLGFFMAGALPKGVFDRHALILQFLNNVKMDYNKIKLYSNEARDLLRFIVADAPESTTADKPCH